MKGSGPDSERDGGMVSFEERLNGGGSAAHGYVELIVQGKRLQYSGARDIRSLLESQGENSAYANVRINGDVLRRRDFENIPVNEGDSIDFLYYMGGG